MTIREMLENDWAVNNGESRNWPAVSHMMDETIRQEIHMEMTPCTQQEFWFRYDQADAGELGNTVWTGEEVTK